MSLAMSKTYKGLSINMKVGSFDAFDLIICLILGAISSVIFGGSKFAALFVVFIPLTMLLILHFSKRGKPEGFLLHLIKYLLSPGHYLAAQRSKVEEKRKGHIYEC